MSEEFKFPQDGTKTNLNFKERISSEWNKYGHFAIFIVIFTAVNALIWWNAFNYLARSDQQAIANEKIGILEGQMQILLMEKQDTINKYKQASSSATPANK